MCVLVQLPPNHAYFTALGVISCVHACNVLYTCSLRLHYSLTTILYLVIYNSFPVLLISKGLLKALLVLVNHLFG